MIEMMKRLKDPLLLALSLCLSMMCLAAHGQSVQPPKREFRGAWIQAVNGQYLGKSPAQVQQFLTGILDELQKARFNAILFQVRPEGDALYSSPYEPWSRYLSGAQGVAPNPAWDPLAFMIKECHKRNMELHAWINPYRAKTKSTTLCATHPATLHPLWVVEYDGQLIFNPALKANRDYICKIAADIVKRYDVDGLHIDDYFYPYPASGRDFDDSREYAADSRGFTNKADWRRDNVNLLIEQLCKTVHATKPWVKFGVSPFGIYRNSSTAAGGSNTRGLQGYDDLYADVLLWIKKGWVDYCIPQIYWEMGHKSADYSTLVDWWARNAGGRPLFIGQDVRRTVGAADLQNPATHQELSKYNLQRSYKSIEGSCQWDAASAASDMGSYLTILSTRYQNYPALMPSFSFIDKKAPKKVKGLMKVDSKFGPVLCWEPREAKEEMDRAVRFVVYRFAKGEKCNLEQTSHILAITSSPFYLLPTSDGVTYTYVVTALDRLQNESKGAKRKIKP